MKMIVVVLGLGIFSVSAGCANLDTDTVEGAGAY